MATGKLVLFLALAVLTGFFLVRPVLASESTESGSVCDRYETAWASRLAAYERAKKIRVAAFAKTQERWNSLFARLESSGTSVSSLKEDSGDVAAKFVSLIAADDAQIAALGEYGKAGCDNSGTKDARSALRAAQETRRTARQAFVKSLRQLVTDLSAIRTQLKED